MPSMLAHNWPTTAVNPVETDTVQPLAQGKQGDKVSITCSEWIGGSSKNDGLRIKPPLEVERRINHTLNLKINKFTFKFCDLHPVNTLPTHYLNLLKKQVHMLISLTYNGLFTTPFVSATASFMNTFILDVIIARGWSIRHLGELTDISYSGIRDYLKGMEQRLSQTRLSRVYDLLELDKEKGLKTHTLYTWCIEIQVERLAALNRVLQGTIDRYTKPDTAAGASESSTDTKTASSHKFEVIPLLGGDTEGLPAPYWVLHWLDIYILVQWQLPKAKRVKKVPDFYSQQDSRNADLPLVNPDIKILSSVCWAPGTELSPEKVAGIHLTSAQLIQLKKAEMTEPLKLETLKDWLQAEPSEDIFWLVAMKKKPDQSTESPFNEAIAREPAPWTWEMVLEKLKRRYTQPEVAAKMLDLE